MSTNKTNRREFIKKSTKAGVAVILADMAMVSGRQMRFDPDKRAIVPA